MFAIGNCNGFRRYTPPCETLPMNTGHLQTLSFPEDLLQTLAYASEKYLLLTVLKGQEHGHCLCCFWGQ